MLSIDHAGSSEEGGKFVNVNAGVDSSLLDMNVLVENVFQEGVCECEIAEHSGRFIR